MPGQRRPLNKTNWSFHAEATDEFPEIAVCSIASDDDSERERAAASIDRFFAIDPSELSTNNNNAANMILSGLEQTGFLPLELLFDSSEGI